MLMLVLLFDEIFSIALPFYDILFNFILLVADASSLQLAHDEIFSILLLPL